MFRVETHRFRAADRFGNHLTVVEHSYFATTKADTHPARKEYRLMDGRQVRSHPNGTYEVVGLGTKLWRV